MRRRIIIFVFSLAATLSAVLYGSLFRHGNLKTVLVLSNATVTERIFDGLRDGLLELGWRENVSIRFITPAPQASPALLRAQARDLIDQDIALVVTLSTPAALAAREAAATFDIPLLMAPASDPVSAGLISSTSHPGQSVTGIAFALQEARRLEMLTRLLPTARHIWVPYNSSDPSPTATVARLRETAAKLGLTLITTDIRSVLELRAALNAPPRSIDAVFLPPDALLASQTRTIVAAASARGLPVTVPHREGVALGALFSYGFDLYALGKQAARLADQILSGTSAADLPIETADMNLSINVTMADRFGITIPEDMLRHAMIIGQPGE